jgi:AcrR family transcriptional regulator
MDHSPPEAALLAAALEVLSQRPGASLAEIAAAAGLSRATLHRVFPGREDLLRALAEDAIAAAEAALGRRGAAPPLDEVFRRLVPLGARFHFLLQETWIDQDAALTARQAKLVDRIDAVLAREREAGGLRDDVPLGWQRRVLLELTWSAWAAVADGTVAPRDAAGLALATFLDGARARRRAAGRR